MARRKKAMARQPNAQEQGMSGSDDDDNDEQPKLNVRTRKKKP
jgi:hypothetical protein